MKLKIGLLVLVSAGNAAFPQSAPPAFAAAERSLGWRIAVDAGAPVYRLATLPSSASAWASAIGNAAEKGASILIVPGNTAMDASVVAEASRRGMKIALDAAVPSTLSPDAALAAAKRSGVLIWADPAAWAKSGQSTLAALASLKEMIAGGTIRGDKDSEEFLKEAYRLDLKPLVWSVPAADTNRVASTLEALVSYHQSYAARTSGVRRLGGVSAEERSKIEAAIPAKAPAAPKKPRRLLVFDLNVGRFGHPSIPYANLAMQLMGERTGAFAVTVSSDPALLIPESLRQFDAVYLNNTIGDIFPSREAREAFVTYIANGGGLIANHATTVTEPAWQEFGTILGARGASHRMTDERVTINVEDPEHPITKVFGGQPFEYADEIFRFQSPYSRDTVRVLLSVDPVRTDMMQGRCYGQCVRDDNDYPIAWIRQYGKGRVFYTTLGHNPHVFWEPRLLLMFLAATQYALGDLDADATPRPRPTDSFDEALAALASYDFGRDPVIARRFERIAALESATTEGVARAESKMLAFLRTNAPLGAKDVVCRQLAIFGSSRSLPLLREMMGQKEIAGIARYALEGIEGALPVAAVAPRPSADALLSMLRDPSADQSGAIVALAKADPARLMPEIPRLSAAHQIQALNALAVQGDKASIPAILAAAKQSDPAVRAAALRCLADVGGATETAMLLEAATRASSPAEREAAQFALVRIPDAGVDRALSDIVTTGDTAQKLVAIRTVGLRASPGAANPLLKLSREGNPQIRTESIRALRAIAGPAEVPALLAALAEADEDREDYATAVADAIRRTTGEPDLAPLTGAIAAARDTDTRVSLLSAAAMTGNQAVLPILRESLGSSDASVRRAAVKGLADWPTPEPLSDLLAAAKRKEDEAVQVLAIRGIARQSRLASQRPPAETASILAAAMELATRPEEKRTLLAALQRTIAPEALAAVRKVQNDAALAAEAQSAATILERALEERQKTNP